MTDDLAIRLTRVLANAAGAIVESIAMVTENVEREDRGEAPAYGAAQFRAVITERGLDWNGIVGETKP